MFDTCLTLCGRVHKSYRFNFSTISLTAVVLGWGGVDRHADMQMACKHMHGLVQEMKR